MKITISATIEKFDKEKYFQAVKREIQKTFMKAGQKFLLAAIPKIPIWTGFARGAFRNAEDLFGKVTADKTSGFRIRTTQGRGTAGRGGGEKITSKFRRGYYYYPPGGGKVLRTPQSGRQFATPTTDIIDITGFSLATGRMSFYFRFAVNIKYVDILDPAKWGAFKAGGEAFKAYVDANLKLPNPIDFTTRKTIRNA